MLVLRIQRKINPAYLAKASDLHVDEHDGAPSPDQPLWQDCHPPEGYTSLHKATTAIRSVQRCWPNETYRLIACEVTP